MKNILVTGGAGYIGSHTCKALAQAGYQPIAYDNLVNGHEWAAQWGPLEVGDISNKARLQKVISRYRPVAVIHFAAYAYVGESIENPLKYFQNNVAGTLCLLESMRDYDINKIVFSSACATYGMPRKIPMTEDHPQQPINPYGMSKLMVEQILKDCAYADDLRSVTLRYFNAAGADLDCKIGEDHDPETHLIPLVLDVAAGKRDPITVFGDDYSTPDGTCIRDYIHVSDLADAHVLALKKLEDGCTSKAINLGNGQGYSVLEVIEMAENITNKNIKVKIGLRRSGDPPTLVANATKAFRELEWKPRFGELKAILDTAWCWAKR